MGPAEPSLGAYLANGPETILSGSCVMGSEEHDKRGETPPQQELCKGSLTSTWVFEMTSVAPQHIASASQESGFPRRKAHLMELS